MEIQERFKLICVSQTAQDAYDAGYDSGRYGTTEKNSHYSFFTSTLLTSAWERGNEEGEKDKLKSKQ